jgi:uncharacterized protein
LKDQPASSLDIKNDNASTETAIQVLERFYEAERKYMQAGGLKAGASFEGMAETLHPDVVLHQSPDLPYGGEWKGHEGFKKWSIAMSEAYEYLDVRDPQFFENEDTVVILCRLITRSRATGTELEYPMAQVMKIRGGKLVECRPFYWNVPAYISACTPPDSAK